MEGSEPEERLASRRAFKPSQWEGNEHTRRRVSSTLAQDEILQVVSDCKMEKVGNFTIRNSSLSLER
ncbi:uncharacterized protein N7469_001316 [Penicillium citrinum]|uniref:Uncharacterized protein n=1 Tax=Penicillium citrinum TaxID=5077 RepID=A0A9W9PEA3_PENCI|nr:uncharacterized protein N7469_001316 [Penicillium citrinum]KAJ5242989.1 hypothetical protein N7469_001316 [Penicillium citrinum]KAK5806397.1 hypothetical protein VI817_000655 [Penicillium citrinum]